MSIYFGLGFVIGLALVAIVTLIVKKTSKKKCEYDVIGVPGVLSIIILLLGLLVFVEVSIFLDAYFAPNKPMPKAWYVIMTLLGSLLIVKFFLDNDYWYRYMNLACGIFVMIIMVSLLVKKLISRKAEKEEDDE